MTADTFTYAGMSSGSKLVYLKGIMVLSVDNQQHEVPIHFILVGGFPSIAPKAYLSTKVDEEVIKNNPYVHKNMEILNQYMNNWKGNHPSYTINICYYYIYQSFQLCPPIQSSITDSNNNLFEEEAKHEPPPVPVQRQGANSSENDKDFLKVCALSKVQDKLDMMNNRMNNIIKKLSVANIKISQNSDLLASYSDNVCTKNAMIESLLEGYDCEKIEQFIENNEGKEINDIDEFVKPEDDVSEKILDFLSDETSCEDTMEIVKSKFRKKQITLEEYLDSVRTLSSYQFMSMAKRRKIMSAFVRDGKGGNHCHDQRLCGNHCHDNLGR